MAKLYTKNTWVDEVLADDERYDILEDDGTPISEDVQIALATAVTTAGSPVNAARMNNIEDGIDDIDDALLDVITTLDVPNLTEKTAPVDDDLFLMFDSEASNAPKKIKGVNMPGSGGGGGASTDGWNADANTWSFSSVDDPTGVITIEGVDATAYLSVGMRFKLTNGGNTIYGIITARSYSSPDTTITFLHEIDPSDSQALHLLANSAITETYYSSVKVPFGFPIEPTKWTVEINVVTQYSQAAPVGLTYYLLDSSLQIDIPIGAWDVHFQAYPVITDNTELRHTYHCALSTDTAAEATTAGTVPDLDLEARADLVTLANNQCGFLFHISKPIVLTAKTTYYVLIMNRGSGATAIYLGTQPTIARAVCAYL